MKQRFCECGEEIKSNNPFQKYCNYFCMSRFNMKKTKKVKFINFKPKRKKNPLIKACDDLWSIAVKVKASKKCEYSGGCRILQSHHIFSRSNKSTRWDLDNGICLESQYHTLNSKFSAHKTPMIFRDWIKEKRGSEWYDKLVKKAHSSIDIDLEKTKQYLECIIKNKPTPF